MPQNVAEETIARCDAKTASPVALAQQVLFSSPVFGILPPEAIDRLAAFARLERFATPTLLWSSGTRLDVIRCVIEGGIALRASTIEGTEISMPPITPGQWTTWISCFGDIPAPHDHWALPNSVFIAFPSTQMRAAAERHPEIYPRILVAISARFRAILEFAVHAPLLDEERRLAKFLYFAAQPAGGDVQPSLAMTQDAIARWAQCSRQTANRLLKSLEQRGFLERGYGYVRILDGEGLMAFVKERL